MMTTDTSEAGLERLIVQALTGRPPRPTGHGVENEPAAYGGAGYIEGHPHDYDREVALDLRQLWRFWLATQASELDKLKIAANALTSTAARQLRHRLQGEITRHGVIHALRKGIKHGPATLQLYFVTPSPGNDKAATDFAANVFSVTRQVRYSRDETQRALDLVLFINGLPLASFELKNHYTRQTVADAVLQYQRDRDPRELLFQFGRCAVHFAVDDLEVRFFTQLSGKSSWFFCLLTAGTGGARATRRCRVGVAFARSTCGVKCWCVSRWPRSSSTMRRSSRNRTKRAASNANRSGRVITNWMLCVTCCSGPRPTRWARATWCSTRQAVARATPSPVQAQAP